ncbi:hypothetical protein ACVXHA_26055 [Escherichia coli]
MVTAAGGTPVMSKTGHAFIKERMREEAPSTVAKSSAHHYFSVISLTATADIIPWLLVAELSCA